MAAKGGSGSDLEKKCVEFVKLSGAKGDKIHQLTSQAAGKMAMDCWGKKYKNVRTYVDASVFPKCKEEGKPYMVISGTKVHDFCERVAFEVVKTKKGAKTPKNDPEVAVVCNDLEGLMISGGPIVKETKISKTGGVDKMTDSSQYTGAHKERFGADGKGKGADGRTDRLENKGYVGQYKGEGSYGKK